MDALELAIFKCIPPSSRILKLSIRRTNNNEEKRVGDHHVEKRRLCCDCRLSDIESVLSILKHVRLNTLQAQTVHGHDIYLKLHGHPLLVSSLFSFFLQTLTQTKKARRSNRKCFFLVLTVLTRDRYLHTSTIKPLLLLRLSMNLVVS